ncbi:MAG: sulfatase-like hydrolase/transferase [Deltaproteobacteria bacterium]|nr:sulfatase-like hydrolase/transferase [Deltaproteobacteria bacterium]
MVFRCRSQFTVWLVAGLVCAALGLACGRHDAVEAMVRDSEFASAGRFGVFLGATPAFAPVASPPGRLIRPLRTTGFEVDYRRVEIRRGPPRGGKFRGTLWAGPAAEGARFSYACPEAGSLGLRAWLFTEVEAEGRRFELRAPRHTVGVAVPNDRAGLYRIEAPLGEGFCAPGSEVSLSLVLPSADDGAGWWLSPPVLIASGGDAPAPVVLISLDTLRRDRWDERAARPAALRELLADSVVFSRVFSSYATTDLSHSVMLSGQLPPGAVVSPMTPSRSIVAALRDAGYATLAFVAGGLVREEFGFGRKAPGFALGFDFYINEMVLDPAPGQRTLGVRSAESYTLAPALERSLRWLARYGDEPFFHWIHGYDVHEYRTVVRRYWDRAVAGWLAAGGRRAELRACVDRVGVQLGETHVVHYPPRPMFRFRKVGKLGADEPCHRRITQLLYEARVLSTEDMLARYIEALKSLGVYQRALIVVTSDHGESLLDDATWDGEMAWGHNRSLATNLLVPLWMKLPLGAQAGRRVTAPVGLVDLRATLGAALGLDLGANDGVDALAETFNRRRVIEFSTTDGYGFVAKSGDLCVWHSTAPERVRRFHDGRWTESDDASRICQALRAHARPTLGGFPKREVPEELEEELRALGYLE